jgi:hypothetical protein
MAHEKQLDNDLVGKIKRPLRESRDRQTKYSD